MATMIEAKRKDGTTVSIPFETVAAVPGVRAALTTVVGPGEQGQADVMSRLFTIMLEVE